MDDYQYYSIYNDPRLNFMVDNVGLGGVLFVLTENWHNLWVNLYLNCGFCTIKNTDHKNIDQTIMNMNKNHSIKYNESRCLFWMRRFHTIDDRDKYKLMRLNQVVLFFKY